MNITLIGESDYQRIASEPNAVPVFTDSYQKEDYSDEFWRFVDSVRTVARAFDADDGSGLGGDYWVSSGFEHSRRVSLELHTPKLLTGSFLAALMLTIQRNGRNYRIDVTHDMLDVEFVFLLIYKDRILAVSDIMTPLLYKLSSGLQWP